MSKKSEAQKATENIKNLLDVYKEYPQDTIGLERDYYYLKSVVEAFQDIQIRQKLGAETKADKLLLQIIAFSFKSYR